jgi:hypothetical protein
LVVGEKSGGHFEKARCEGESAPGFFSLSPDRRLPTGLFDPFFTTELTENTEMATHLPAFFVSFRGYVLERKPEPRKYTKQH